MHSQTILNRKKKNPQTISTKILNESKVLTVSTLILYSDQSLSESNKIENI